MRGRSVSIIGPTHRGPARRLIPSVIDLVKTVNRSLRLGQLLCQCREPDFLLSIIQRQVVEHSSCVLTAHTVSSPQGTEKSMSWLRELVESSSHSSLEALPVPCLCEFLLSSYQERGWVESGDGSSSSSSYRSIFKKKQKLKEKVSVAGGTGKGHILLLQSIQHHEQLVSILRSMVLNSSSSSFDVLKYFLEKLSVPQLMTRQLALMVRPHLLPHPLH